MLPLQCQIKSNIIVEYKGYKIGKVSRYLYGGRDDQYYWNVNKDYKNVCFTSLRKAKQWINEQINKNN